MRVDLESRVSVELAIVISDHEGPITRLTRTLDAIPHPAAMYIQGRVLESFESLSGWGMAMARGEEPKITP